MMGNTLVWKKKWQPMKFCQFSRGKTTENGSVSAQRSTWRGEKHLKIEGVNFLIFEKTFFEIYIKFACWWWFCYRSAKHLHIVLCVWICNSELRHVRIFVTPCSFYVLLQCDGKARCFFFGIKMPVGWQNFIENANCVALVGPRSNAVSPHGIVVLLIEQTLLWDRH